MIRLFLPLAVAAGLSACASLSTPIAAPTSSAAVALANPALDRLEREYRAAAAFAEIFIPYLPDARQAQVRAAQARIKDLFRRARRAVTMIEQIAAIEAAGRELAGFKLATGN